MGTTYEENEAEVAFSNSDSYINIDGRGISPTCAPLPLRIDGVKIHELKLRIQGFLQPNTVIVVGLGPSAAFGLPTMDTIAKRLLGEFSSGLNVEDQKAWSIVSERLKTGTGLESALQSVQLCDSLYEQIVRITGSEVIARESEAIAAMFSSDVMPPFARLLKYLSPGSPALNVVTTNYDRLIEVQAELAGLGVDVGYPGSYASPYNPESSAKIHKSRVKEGKSFRTRQDSHVRVYKPHGSLDWTRAHGFVRRSMAHVVPYPAIIAPGPSKYRTGYEEHFARERELAIVALKAAQRFIVIGYGFNDDQLEQSWCYNLMCDKPLLILTKTLSPNALQLIAKSKFVLAMSELEGQNGCTLVSESKSDAKCVERDIWSLDGFMKEITFNGKDGN